MKTVIEMAREAGLHRQQHNLMSNPVQYRFSYDGYEENLERFAELVRADERARMATKQTEAMKLALEALEVLGWQPTEEAMDYRDNAITALREALAQQPSQQPSQQCKWPTCQSEEYQQALAEQIKRELVGDQPAQQQEPVAIEYWLQDTMESGRWVTTDNMAKATAEKMLSGEYGDVYPQGRIVEPSPPAIEAALGIKENT